MTGGKWFRAEFFGWSPIGAVPEPNDYSRNLAAALGRSLGMSSVETDSLIVTDLIVQPPPPGVFSEENR
jgi:hypothetical protein